MDCEHDNLRTALHSTLEHAELDSTLRFASALARFWNGHSHLAEGCLWLEAILAQSRNVISPARAEALLRLGKLSRLREDYATARLYLEQSLELWQVLGDTRGIIEVLIEVGMFNCIYKCIHQSVNADDIFLHQARDDIALAFAFGRRPIIMR